MKKVYLYFLITFLCLPFTGTTQKTTLQLTLKGKDSIETKALDSIPYKAYFENFVELNKEIDSLRETLNSKGYLDHIFLGTTKISDSLVLGNFELNTRYKKIKIFYDNTFLSEELIKHNSIHSEKNYFVTTIDKVEDLLKLLTNYLVNQGLTFSSVLLETLKKEDQLLSANLVVSTGKSRTIDDIVTKGYEKFPKSYFKYYAGIRKQKIFKKEEIVNKSRKLDNLRFAKNIKPPEVLFNKDSTSVYFYLEKQSANTFDGFLGFSSNNETNNLELNGYLNLNLINNLNFGEELHLIYKNDGNDQQRFEVNTSLPYIAKTPLGIEAGLNIFRRDTTFLITEQNLNLNYYLNDRSKVFIGYETTDSNNLLEIPNTTINAEDYSSSFVRAGFSFVKTQNNLFFPIKSNYRIMGQLGSRKIDIETTSQTKGQIDLSHIITLNRRNSIYLKNTSAAIFSDTFFINELYRFGGINSMRGFEENTINASLYNVLNTEYRYILSSNLYIHSIIDYAYFEDDSNSLSDNLTSFGFGLGLRTATGIFRIIFANGKSSSQNFDFSNTKVHLSLNAFF